MSEEESKGETPPPPPPPPLPPPLPPSLPAQVAVMSGAPRVPGMQHTVATSVATSTTGVTSRVDDPTYQAGGPPGVAGSFQAGGVMHANVSSSVNGALAGTSGEYFAGEASSFTNSAGGDPLFRTLGNLGNTGSMASRGEYVTSGSGMPRNGTASLKLDISHKPPTMKGSFDLYEVQLRAFLTRLGCWSVVDGSCRENPRALIDFTARDNAAREAILVGVPSADAEMICQEVTAEAMWNHFVDRQTKREYSNYIFTRDEFVSNRFTPDKNMGQWIREMEMLRRQLLHFGKQVSDEDYAETLLGHVSRTHRDVVRQFSRHYTVRDGGAVRPVPTAAQVVNALLAETALDERVARDAESKPTSICSCGKQMCDEPQLPKSKQHQGKGKRFKGKGRFKSKPKQGWQQQGKMAETRSCHACGEVGHLKANCPNRKGENSSKPSISEFKRWQPHNKGDNDNHKHGRKGVSALCCHVSGEPVTKTRSTITPAGTDMEWVLDSASDVHVCNQDTVLHNLRTDNVHFFQGFDGMARENERVGDMTLRVRNSKSPYADLTLPFNNVLFTPTAPDNLLSMDKLESDGWNVKFGFVNSQRVCWLRKDHTELLLLKTNRRYRLKATAVAVYKVQSEVQGQMNDSIVTAQRKRADATKLERWHLRFAHLNLATLQQMARRGTASGMGIELRQGLDSPCWTCKTSKMTRMSYKRTGTRRVTKPYQKLMSDMCYVGETTYNRYEHFQLVQDEASRYLWGFLMHRKEEATEVVMTHLKWLIAQGHRIELLSSDQGRELLNLKMKAFLQSEGIEFTWTNSYSPEENGLVEKMNGVVMARVRCLLSAANMPWSLWGEAFEFAIDVINISASAALDGETPYCRRFGSPPDVSTLRTWGCVVFIFTPKVLRKSKLENPGKPGLLMGYAKHYESYRVLNLSKGSIDEVRSVEFQEDWTVERSYVEKLLSNRYGTGRHVLQATIPFVRLPVLHPETYASKRSAADPNDRLPKHHCNDDRNVFGFPIEVGGEPAATRTGVPGRWTCSSNEVPERSTEVQTRPTPAGAPQSGGNAPWIENFDRAGGESSVADLSNSSQTRAGVDLPDREGSISVGDRTCDGLTNGAASAAGTDGEANMDDTIAFGDPVDLVEQISVYDDQQDSGRGNEKDDGDENDGWRGASPTTSFRSTSFRRSPRVRRPNVRLQDYEVEIPASLVIQAVHELMEPQSVREALQAPDSDKWREALSKEFEELMRNNTWVLVERPKGKKILTSKWVFVRKRNPKGEVIRHRARITIKGCQQEFGVNFWETYAPVVSFEAVKLVLLLALHFGLHCEQIDFVTAFLNGPIDDGVEIFMEMPEYFNDGSGRVCKLLRSLYGLKQAPLIWYRMLDEYLRSCGFKRSKMDNGVYWRVHNGSPVFLTVYVDDVLIAATAENVKVVISELELKFKIKDLGSVNLLLGMEITYIPGQAMWIAQRRHIEKVLNRFQMETCRAVPTPQTLGELSLPATQDHDNVNNPAIPYRAVVGCLQYLVQCSRPEIANAVRTLGKYLNAYTNENYTMAKRVLRYLRGTIDYGLVWEKVDSPDLHFVAYADADLGNEKDDRKSITGYVLQVNGCTYAYKSRKQRIVTDDTCCAEFVAASECSTMIIWTHNLCKELGLKRHRPTVLYQDNQAAITVITEIRGNYKTKSVDLKYHKVRDYHERGEFEVRYCPSTDMLADIFTKPLGPTLFNKFRQRLNVLPLPIAVADVKPDSCTSEHATIL